MELAQLIGGISCADLSATHRNAGSDWTETMSFEAQGTKVAFKSADDGSATGRVDSGFCIRWAGTHRSVVPATFRVPSGGMLHLLKRLESEVAGAMAEYVLLAALVGMGAIAGALLIGDGLRSIFTAESQHVNPTEMIDIP